MPMSATSFNNIFISARIEVEPTRRYQHFWRSLQVEHHFVELLSDLDLHWDGRVLRIHESWSGRGDAIDEISACLLYLLSWCSFSETRWAKVGVCGRRYIGSLCAGIDRLHQICMGDPHITRYHLSGYGKADKHARSLLCTAAYSALPSESLLLELFEDDRYLRRSEALWDTVETEVSYLADLPMFVWNRIASIACLEMSGEAFRGQVLHSTHISVGYVWQEIWEP